MEWCFISRFLFVGISPPVKVKVTVSTLDSLHLLRGLKGSMWIQMPQLYSTCHHSCTLKHLSNMPPSLRAQNNLNRSTVD